VAAEQGSQSDRERGRARRARRRRRAADALHRAGGHGTAVVGSDINESGAKLYQVGAKGLTLERDGTTEHLSVSADRKTLTVRISNAAAATTLVYSRKTDVDPCEQWPTGCKW
jgi:hypothetical protein